jgi:hypothetical protein
MRLLHRRFLMKTLNHSLIIALAILSFVSCTRKAEQAAQYNDIIIQRQKDIIAAFDRFDSTFADSIASEDEVEFAFVNMQSNIKHSILSIDSIGPFQNDPLLQQSARDLFTAYDIMVEDNYRILKDIKLMPAESITAPMIDTTISVQIRIHDVSKLAQEKFLKAQEEFGKKYNLTFE